LIGSDTIQQQSTPSKYSVLSPHLPQGTRQPNPMRRSQGPLPPPPPLPNTSTPTSDTENQTTTTTTTTTTTVSSEVKTLLHLLHKGTPKDSVDAAIKLNQMLSNGITISSFFTKYFVILFFTSLIQFKNLNFLADPKLNVVLSNLNPNELVTILIGTIANLSKCTPHE
jgi:hypothetical protein